MPNASRELLELLRRELGWQHVLRELDQAIAAVMRRLRCHFATTATKLSTRRLEAAVIVAQSSSMRLSAPM